MTSPHASLSARALRRVRKLLRAVRAFVRKPVPVPVAWHVNGKLYLAPVHFNALMRTESLAASGKGPRTGEFAGIAVRTGMDVVSDHYVPAWRYPTRFENAREAWRT